MVVDGHVEAGVRLVATHLLSRLFVQSTSPHVNERRFGLPQPREAQGTPRSQRCPWACVTEALTADVCHDGLELRDRGHLMPLDGLRLLPALAQLPGGRLRG